MAKFISSNFIFNNINNLFIITAFLIIIFTIFSSVKEIKKYKILFFLLMFLFFISFFLVTATNNWFIFMIGWELATLTTSLLLSWDDKNIAWEYFVIQFIGGSFLIITVLIAYTHGYLTISPIKELWLQLMFIIALGVKSAVIGLHSWVPYIYKKASTTFCAISSSLVAKLGYITLLRIITEGNKILLYIGTIMIFYGGIKALEEKNYKLLLAYSSISQFGFITLAIGSGNIYGYYGAVLHITAHAFAKSTLFNAAGNLIREYNSTSIFAFKCCKSKEKIIKISTIFSFLSLMAFPLFIGYNSKHLIKYSLKSIPVFVFLLHLGSILTISYSLKVLWIVIFKDFKRAEFNLKKINKNTYQLNFFENTALIIPAVLLIFLALTANFYLDSYFEFHYLPGFILTLIYLITAYLIPFPIIARLEKN